MNKDITRTVRQFLFFTIIAFFVGIHIGAKSAREQHRAESIHREKVAMNCLEVLIGRRPKGKLCQK